MSTADRQIGRLLARPNVPAQAGLSLQRATVVTWDATNGYVITYAGSTLADVLVLASAGTISPGDQVAVLVQKTSALIIGVITTPS